jgi:hypothetical protein
MLVRDSVALSCTIASELTPTTTLSNLKRNRDSRRRSPVPALSMWTSKRKMAQAAYRCDQGRPSRSCAVESARMVGRQMGRMVPRHSRAECMITPAAAPMNSRMHAVD